MARSREETKVNLFPFLSVLCAVIGVMILFIVLTLGTRVVQQEQKYAALQEGISTPQPGKPDVLTEGIDQRNYQKLDADAARLLRSLEERKKELEGLEDRRLGLEALVEAIKDGLLVRGSRPRPHPHELARPKPVVMVETDPYQFVPKGNRDLVRLTPVFVEVRSDGYTVYPSRESFPPIRLPSGEEDASKLDADPALREFLKNFDDDQKTRKYLVFLIHPNGVEAFHGIRVYLLLNHEKIRMGWEPFSRTWLLANTDKK